MFTFCYSLPNFVYIGQYGGNNCRGTVLQLKQGLICGSSIMNFNNHGFNNHADAFKFKFEKDICC